MKLRCINAQEVDGRLTTGKVYEQVATDSVGDYWVIDEKGRKALFYQWHFASVAKDACPQCGLKH
jgi:hypothetical protein